MPGTVIYQSFRKHNVPAWTSACMDTVRAWAKSAGFEYRFIDDTLFDRVPAWFREKAAGQICPVTDLARLIVAKELLQEGFERAVWVDADMLVFDPQRIHVEIPRGFAFSLEMWVSHDANGKPVANRHVNNSMMVFHRRNVHLPFFIDMALRLGKSQERIGKLAISTVPLTRLYNIAPYPLLRSGGTFSPAIMRDIASGQDTILSFYASKLPVPIGHANLCGSLESKVSRSEQTGEALYAQVVQTCLASKGHVVNGLMQAQRA